MTGTAAPRSVIKRLRLWSAAIATLVAAAAVATYGRYASFDPCVWMEQDLAQRSGLPRLIVRGRIRAEFLLRGVAEPDGYQCLRAWWEFRAEGLPKSG